MTRLNTPHDPNKKPAPKLHATEVPPPKAGEKENLHD
jgi:hypothetical protein